MWTMVLFGGGSRTLGIEIVRIVIVDPDELRARTLAASLHQEGTSPFVASDPEGVRTLGRSAHVLLVAPTASAEALSAVLGLGRPFALLDDGSGVPPALVRADPVACIPIHRGGSIRAALEAGLERRARANDSLRCEAALESAGAGILLVTPDGQVQRANAAFARLASGIPRDLTGLTLVELLIPEGGEDPRQRFREAVAGLRAWNGEAVLSAGGVHVPCSVTLAPIRSGDIEADGLVVTLVDLRDRRALEDSLREANRNLERKAFVDALTGLYNRAFLAESIQRELARSRRSSTTLAVLMIDLDHFKKVNDDYGHGAGDEVLMAVSGALRVGLREGDILARYGGDEFCALLPGADAVSAWQVAERVRLQVASLPLGIAGAVKVRASIGLATSADLEEGAGALELLDRADRALLVAKRQGRDHVVASGGAVLPFRAELGVGLGGDGLADGSRGG